MDTQTIVGVSSIIVAIFTVGGGLGKMLFTIRNNDLKHLDIRLDGIDRKLEKIDDRLEQHLEHHVVRHYNTIAKGDTGESS